MSRGPGRWQRTLLAAVEQAGHFKPVSVSDAGLDALGRSMTAAEYRALNRAAWALDGRAVHLGAARGEDCLGRASRRLTAWTCPKCSPAATGQHIPVLPCATCGSPTDHRDFLGRADCGAHPPKPPDPSLYTVHASDKVTSHIPIDDVLRIREDGTVTVRAA